MKIRKVTVNNHKKAFEVRTYKGVYSFPFAKLDIVPTRKDPVAEVYADEELGREAFTYRLCSGREGTVHIDHVLEYNRDPSYMRDLLLYQLTVQAAKLVEQTGLSKRELIRRMGTSPSQFYRLLDKTNYRKSLDQLVSLLRLLDYDVEINVRRRAA
jgi:predicted XRE-type DNA-binding protein